MSSDFDRVVDRRNTNSLKWGVAEHELPMWVADMDFPTAPAVRDAIAAKVATGILGYTTVPDEFAESVGSWWRRRHDFDIDSSWVTFCSGVVPAVSSIVRTLTVDRDKVLVMPPVYNVFYASIRNNGRETACCDLLYADGRYSMDLGNLERHLADRATRLLILCNPQNPTGTIWPQSTLATIGELCRRHGVTVLSDEIHCDLTSPGTRYTPFAAASSTCAAVSITCVSPSKAFNLAGVHSAAVIIPDPDLRARVMRGLNRDEIAEPNAIAIEGAVAAFTHGEPWLDALRSYLHQNRQFARTWIGNEIPALRVVDANATYLLWIDCSQIVDDADDLCAELRRTTGLLLSPGSSYGVSGRPFLRMNLACPRSRLEDGLDRLRTGVALFTQ